LKSMQNQRDCQGSCVMEYTPYTKLVQHDVEREEKLFHLGHHGEKLAIALGLINTAPHTPL